MLRYSMMFDFALHYLGQNKEDVFVLNIGAMDGVMFDEMYEYTKTYGFQGLYVEPIPYLFEKLKNNISGGLFENCAVSDYDGEIEMVMIDPDVIDSGLIHRCFYGMSAVYPPKNGLGNGDEETVAKYGKRVRVQCMKFETLMRKHRISAFDVVKIDAEGHDYQIFKQIDLDKYRPKVIRIEWINLAKEEYDGLIDLLNKHGYIYEVGGQDIVAVLDEMGSIKQGSIVTFVTGLWNLRRDTLSEGWSRSYQTYLDHFSRLLVADVNMIIFGDTDLEEFVWKIRGHHNTLFFERNLDWFKNNDYFDLIQKIRNDPKWYGQVGWLENSTQAKLEYYNPVVMSKMFLLNDARILDGFGSDYLFWLDAGIANTVHPGYFYFDKVQLKLPKYVTKFTFVTFPYEANTEIHGFDFGKICELAGSRVDKVARGGFFGGPMKSIQHMNSIYYNLLMDTLRNGLMGTEESLFSIILCKYAYMANFIEIESNGLLCKFFEDLKNDNVVIKINHHAIVQHDEW